MQFNRRLNQNGEKQEEEEVEKRKKLTGKVCGVRTYSSDSRI